MGWIKIVANVNLVNTTMFIELILNIWTNSMSFEMSKKLVQSALRFLPLCVDHF